LGIFVWKGGGHTAHSVLATAVMSGWPERTPQAVGLTTRPGWSWAVEVPLREGRWAV